MPLVIPPPLCAKCHKVVDEMRVENLPGAPSPGLIATATCHGETETTELPEALLTDLTFGRAWLTQGEAFRDPA